MKVALVHDWLIHMRGGEKVLEGLAELYPDAVIYTLFYNRPTLSPSLQRMKIKASFLQSLPGIKKYYRWLLPILPWVIRTLKVDQADLVISSSHCVSKGIKKPAGALHVCYCHTPMRYLWGYEQEYFANFPFFLKPLLAPIKTYLKTFDLKSNEEVDQFIANAENVRKRIKTFYGRESTVIYPPLNTESYSAEVELASGGKNHYYLVVSAFVPYKRVDLVIEAFNRLNAPLKVVGGGPLEKAYQDLKKSSQIEFLGSVSDHELRKLYAGARAVIFPTEEDFGIVPLEAQACGTPVIAFGKGGALESVKHGHFFYEQTPEALCEAVKKFEDLKFDRSEVSHAVNGFSKQRFKEQIRAFIQEHLSVSRP
jgi:glycosyltransferase involved in cell wall biosynthesis